MKFRVYSLGGYNTYSSPFQMKDGEMLRCQNVDPFPAGAKTKRAGYGTLLGTADGSAVTSLFDFHRNDGTTFWLYRYSGSTLYYSVQGTGAWTICGNGTMAAGANIGYTILNNTLILGDGVGSTRHSTDGTSFTNTSLAPIANYFENFGGRVYAGGTANTLFWSTIGDATNWSSAGTADSSSIDIPGPGKINSVKKVIDRVIVSKNSGVLFRWDGYNLTDMTTNLGPTTDQSIGEIEDYKFFLNRSGIFGFGGDHPQLVSNQIQRVIYNDSGSGVAGTTFENTPGETFKYNYYCALGSITDDFTGETTTNAIAKYNFQLNEWGLYKFNNYPTSFTKYKDNTLQDQFIFGASNGQVYTYGGSALDDAGQPIEAIMEFVVTAQAPESYKEWKSLELLFNPGNEAKVQVAMSDTFTRQSLKWQDLGDCSSGVAYFRPSENTRSRFLFVKIYESSRNSRFTFFGYSYNANVIEK
jgi:NADPH-dependent 7-cyano-7-deazaguanine reductase QueF-like protein